MHWRWHYSRAHHMKPGNSRHAWTRVCISPQDKIKLEEKDEPRTRREEGRSFLMGSPDCMPRNRALRPPLSADSAIRLKFLVLHIKTPKARAFTEERKL